MLGEREILGRDLSIECQTVISAIASYCRQPPQVMIITVQEALPPLRSSSSCSKLQKYGKRLVQMESALWGILEVPPHKMLFGFGFLRTCERGRYNHTWCVKQ